MGYIGDTLGKGADAVGKYTPQGIAANAAGRALGKGGNFIGDAWGDMTGQPQSREAGKKYDEAMGTVDPEYDKLSGLSEDMKGAGQEYVTSAGDAGEELKRVTREGEGDYREGRQQAEGNFQQETEAYKRKANEQATDAQAVYDNTISKGMMNIMDDAKAESDTAMTLMEAQDPNNPVAASFRNFYNQQAQGEGRAGMADVGTLQALGAQAFGNIAGAGGPMTGGQMQALQGGTQQQAGQAFGNVQKRMQGLRDQGREQGWAQTDKAYGRGQGAKDRYRDSVVDVQGAQGANINQQMGLRGEGAGYTKDVAGSQQRESEDVLGSQQREAGVDYGVDMGASERGYGVTGGNIARDASLVSGKAGTEREILTGQAGIEAEEGAGKRYMLSQFLGSAAQGAGAAYGSDERLKTDIEPLKKADLEEFLEAVNPVTFKYKDSNQPQGVRPGFIAQDVVGTKLGAMLVREKPDGMLEYDPHVLMGILLAVVKML